MKISRVEAQANFKLAVINSAGQKGVFDVKPYLDAPAFLPLNNQDEFAKIVNNGYFIAWDCGADLSADTIEAHWQLNCS
ncbi:MAG TPA: DUF2442 domain-containing protein [Oceanospirillaceae bacterium]|nr:DUF2442 domain-containing protein [Oceanospirillaceae bacterium]